MVSKSFPVFRHQRLPGFQVFLRILLLQPRRMRRGLLMEQTNHLTPMLHRKESWEMGRIQRARDSAGSAGFDQSLPAVCPPLEMKTPRTVLTQRSLPEHLLLTMRAQASHQHLLSHPHPCQVPAPSREAQVGVFSKDPQTVVESLKAWGLEGSRGHRVFLLSSTPSLVPCLLRLPCKVLFLSTIHLRSLSFPLLVA